jgi:hypothetical protein
VEGVSRFCHARQRGDRHEPGRFSLINPSYYATLAQVAEALIERELAEAVTVASSLQELVHMVTQHLKGCIEREEA